jgi:leader peptidase (prepilin peptidase)/N-methyltransferase
MLRLPQAHFLALSSRRTADRLSFGIGGVAIRFRPCGTGRSGPDLEPDSLSFIDVDRQLLPDDLTLPLLWAGLLFNIFAVFVPLSSAVIGAIAGYVSLWLVYQLFKLTTGKEGMGYGDFKLFAVFGAWLGWQSLPLIILLASLVGAVVGISFIVFFGHDRRMPIPFGPFLCAAGWIALLWGEALTRLYLQFARIAV